MGPHAQPLITDVAGKVVMEDIIDGITVRHTYDDLTGQLTIEITSKDLKEQRLKT